ncbi:MAG: lysophospholipid acyltransferase family protein [Myxococcaceae bacterium]
MRNLFCIFVAGAWTTVLFPFTCVAMLLTLDAGVSLWFIRRLWSPVLLWAGGARLVVKGRENVDPMRPTIYVSNHQSTIDIPALFLSIPADLRYVSKTQLKYVPFLGWYMMLAGYPFVDRGNHRAAVASLDAAGARIRRGISIVVYPEGTRSADGRILPFKKGSFVLALKARVAICPVAIEGSGRLMPKNSWRITPGDIKVAIGKPIDVGRYGEDQREELMRDVRKQMIDLHLSLGGPGGDVDEAIAARGLEGIGRPKDPAGTAGPGGDTAAA